MFSIGQKEKNLLMMQSSHDAANFLRLKYESRVDRVNYFKDGIVYTDLTKDMYNELLFGNVKEIPLLDDPLFYAFDGTFALAYKGLTKLAVKTMGKKSVDKTTDYLIKLDLQMFGKSIQKLDDKFIKKMGIDAHDLKYDFLGKNAKISQYDLYIDKATKEIMIFKKGGKGEGISTGYFTD
ncbi:polymorphic toxin type 33 domain-containing protein [Paenibacillus sp. UMB4589-SE434]|nr:polymorphic toxin type 33 domain-containing protein [Paenibacillus sp. UMB4589-SE434]